MISWLPLVGVVALLAACPATAAATCQTAGYAAYDAEDDAGTVRFQDQPLVIGAPEITRAVGSIDEGCVIRFVVDIRVRSGRTTPLIAAESLSYDLDVDNDPATGAPGTGTDFAVVITGHDEFVTASLLRWTGSRFTSSTLPSSGGVGFALGLQTLGVVAPTTLKVRVRSTFASDYQLHDWAPDQGLQPLVLPVQGVVPSVPAASTAPAPVTTPAPGPVTCLVPAVKGRRSALAIASLRRAGCPMRTVRRSSRTVRRSRVIATTPRAGVRTAATVTVIVSTGKPKAKRRG